MKTRDMIFRLSSLVCAVFLLGGCDDAKYEVIRHAVYFTDAASSPQKSVLIEETGGQIPITVRSVGRVESDVTVHCVVDPAVLEDYNAKAGTSFALLPEAIYTIPHTFVIPQGQAVSIAGVIEVGAYTEEMKNSGSQYALPLRLVSPEGGPQLLGSSECLVLSLDQVIVTSAIVLSKARAPFIHLPFSQAYELSQWTLEFRFNKSMMTNTVGQNIAFGGDEGGYEVRTAVGASHKFYTKVNTVEMATPHHARSQPLVSRSGGLRRGDDQRLPRRRTGDFEARAGRHPEIPAPLRLRQRSADGRREAHGQRMPPVERGPHAEPDQVQHVPRQSPLGGPAGLLAFRRG